MDDSLTVIIAPDSFKGSATAWDAARAIADGWSFVRPLDTLILLPQADGGEGTLEVIAATVPDAVRRSAGTVTGPDGRGVEGQWLELPGRRGIVELAQCSGLTLMGRLDALGATTRGLGEVIRVTLDAGMQSVVVALGGSASTDGGAGALAALGFRFLDAKGRALSDGGASLANLFRVEPSAVAPPPRGITLLVDVNAPLLGPRGAAAIFGPQKGASASDMATLDIALAMLASHLGGSPSAQGAGAAGGTAYGFAAAWGARIESGAKYLQNLTGLSHEIKTADVVITGEGHFDETSRTGKVVGEVLALARHEGVRAGVVAGQLGAATDAWTCSLVDLAGSIHAATLDPQTYLTMAGEAAAAHFAVPV